MSWKKCKAEQQSPSYIQPRSLQLFRMDSQKTGCTLEWNHRCRNATCLHSLYTMNRVVYHVCMYQYSIYCVFSRYMCVFHDTGGLMLADLVQLSTTSNMDRWVGCRYRFGPALEVTLKNHRVQIEYSYYIIQRILVELTLAIWSKLCVEAECSKADKLTKQNLLYIILHSLMSPLQLKEQHLCTMYYLLLKKQWKNM